jgi:flagellar biosynthetic protein FlhB
MTMGLTLGVGLLALSMLLPAAGTTLVNATRNSIINVSPRASNSELLAQTGSVFTTLLALILPLACLVMVAGVAANLVSGGLVLSPKAVRFDMSRINPLAGFKRLADRQALVRLGIASAKLAILATISWQVVGSRVPSIVNSQGSGAEVIVGTCLSAIFQLGLTITILLAVVALVDFVVQRRKAQQSIKMSKEDIKQEYREQEGDPLVRGARRRRARQMAFARMMDAVPTADVVVTNPTTLAVALKYDSLTMRAPRIVAKGQRLMADRIKQVAREYRVLVIEDKPLARALFPRPIGSEVPSHLYRAVARLLVLVHQARFNAANRSGARGAQQGWVPGQAMVVRGSSPAQPWWTANASAAGETGGVSGLRGTGTATVVDARFDAAADPFSEMTTDMDRDDVDSDDAWLDSAALDPSDVDEEALAAALAEDELSDMTADEMARLEASLVLDDDSSDSDDEEPAQ